MTEDDKYDGIQNLNMLEHVHKAPDVWGAENQITKSEVYLYNLSTKKLQRCKVEFSPLWLKMVDEILVNCFDQKVRLGNKLQTIMVSFDEDTGEISVYNDGKGIPIIKHEDHGIYLPELAFCKFLTGKNFSRKKSVDKITGGKNGIGAKLTNAFSSSFIIETSDKSSKKYYYQEVRDCMRDIQPPEITSWNNLDDAYSHAFTRITYTPNYPMVGYKKGYNKKTMSTLFYQLLYTRCLMLSLSTKLSIILNDEEITCVNAYQLMTKLVDYDEYIMEPTIFKDKSEDKDKRLLNWDVCIAVTPADKFNHIVLVNGIHTIDGGSHVQYLLNNLTNKKQQEDICKQLNVNRWNVDIISKHLCLVMNCHIEDPQFNGQGKEKLKAPTKFSHEIPKTFIPKVWKKLKLALEDRIDLKNMDTESKVEKVNLQTIEKYEPAIKSRSRVDKERLKCSLWIPEGDSAQSFVNSGLTEKKTLMGGYTYNGIFNMGGKPMNARKNIKVVKKSANETVIIRQQKLKDNKRLSDLVKVLGLDYTYKYEMNVKGNSEFNKLRYGCIVIATDQDVDGVGHICSLIMNFIHLFWPNLYKRGFVKRLATPIIIAFPTNIKNFAISFYTSEQYNKWCIDKFGGEDKVKGYNAEYFKGLAGHELESIVNIFKNIQQSLYTFDHDNITDQLFDVYFGEDTASRKLEINKPLVPYEPVQYHIQCSEHLQYETKEYMKEDICRSLPHVIDGLRSTARLVVAGSRSKFKSNNNPIKVFQLGSYVALELNYHQGDQSMNDVIIKLAQSFPGARNLPPLLKRSAGFGSRRMGGDDAGASRYIKLCLNKDFINSLYPPVDDFLLEYNYEEGQRCGPKYYIPILPMVILEDFTAPATGWASSIFARDYNAVFQLVKDMIHGKNVDDVKLPYWMRSNNCTIEDKSNNGLHLKFESIAQYKIKGDVVHITDLPPRLWDSKWKSSIVNHKNFETKYADIESIENNSTDIDIDIKVIFKKNTLKNYTNEKLETYLGLKKSYSSNINVLNLDCHSVMEYQSYEEIIPYWFKERKKMYSDRIDRRIILLKWLIIKMEQMIKYCLNYTKYNLSRKSRDYADKLLETHLYIKINNHHLENPSYTKIDVLEDYIQENASYDYLLDLRDKDKLDTAIEKHQEKLATYKKELEDLQRKDPYFKGATIWLNELDELNKIIINGLESNWIDKKSQYKYS